MIVPSLYHPDRDHPRSRGVYRILVASGIFRLGSSPLARGLLVDTESPTITARIIPARAGFTPGDGRLPGGQQDHPRSRGVYTRARRATTSRTGSSPLARGLRDVLYEERLESRIIPARAGFTTHRRSSVHDHPDHPRSRGVYRTGSGSSSSSGGSSPLARGLQPDGCGDVTGTRIIPARAGFTR